MEALITKSKYYDTLGMGGMLTYDTKKSVYHCYVDGKHIWKKEGSPDLFNYVLEHHDEFGNLIKCLDYDEIRKYDIYKEYSDTVQKTTKI